MLLQRLRWLVLALIVSWTNLHLNAALPAPEERSRVFANTFGPSVATATMIRPDSKHAHPPDGKNDTQSGHKLVASPAGLLRPDKFQFYTYDEKGDMITRQMTVEEIQGLIAAGGADHVAMDRQEPQKADDVLTGGKKVMDVVQKVQNVLKSALDKPPTVTGTLPKIPEQANVEWSNILPSILSGEADAISASGESHRSTTERTEAGGGRPLSVESAPNLATSATSPKAPTRRPDVQTNAYAGFTNNVQHGQQQAPRPAAEIVSEKPMIPVPVITLTEQKLSTLPSAVTESPVFQMLSVIPVETGGKEGQTDSPAADTGIAGPAATQLFGQTEGYGQTDGQFVELALSEVPEDTTFSLLTSLDTRPADITKQTTVYETGTPAIHSMTTPAVAGSAAVGTKQTIAYDQYGGATSMTDRIPTLNASYILLHNRNNTKPSADSSFTSGVTKEPQANGAHNKIIPQASTITLKPLSHVTVPLKPEEAPDKTASHSPSTLASPVKASTVPISAHTNHRPGGGSSAITKESLGSVTPTYAESHPKPRPAETKVPPMEPLGTQLIDSLSSVMNQISEVRPSVIALSSASNQAPQMSSVDTRHDAFLPHHTIEESVERVASTQAYATATARIPSQDITTWRIDLASITRRPVSTTKGTTSSGLTAGSSVTAPIRSDVESTSTMISQPTSSPVSTLAVRIHTSPEHQTKTPATLQVATATDAVLEKHTISKVTSSAKISPTASAMLGAATKTQSTTASITSEPLRKPTPINELDNALANLNLSNPVSAIDQVLNIAPSLPSGAPAIEPIGLPNDTSNFVANDLASGLIAGFTTSGRPSVGEAQQNQMAKNATSSAHTARPTTSPEVTKLPEPIENVTQTYEKTVGLDTKDDYQKEKNITQGSTQEPLLMDSAGTGALITQTKAPNIALKPTKLPSNNDRFDDSTKASSSPATDKFANIGGELEDSIGQSTITMGIVTVHPERLSTVKVDVQTPSVDGTPLDKNNNQKLNREKLKTTEAPVVRTDASPPIKIANVNNTKNILHLENNQRFEMLGENGGSSNVSSATKEAAPLHSASSADSHKRIGNVTTDIATSDSAIVANRNATKPALSQNLNRANNTIDQTKSKIKDQIKDKDTNVTKLTTPHAATNNRTAVQNKNNYSNGTSSSSLSSTDSPIATQELSGSTGDNKVLSRPSPVNGTNNLSAANNTSIQNNKDTFSQHTSKVNASAPVASGSTATKNATVQTSLNNTESKPASLKHSENSPKQETTRLPLSTPSPIPTRQTSKPATSHWPVEKFNVSKTDAEMSMEDKWTLISQQSSPTMGKLPKPPRPLKPPRKPPGHGQTSPSGSDENLRSPGAPENQQDQQDSLSQLLPLDASQSASGLDVTVRHTSADIVNFARLCNELAFNFWVATNKGLSTARSLALSPFGMTSLLAMIFLGARGPTSDQMNEVLGLDDVATFNPHLVFQNITDTVSLTRGHGIANAAFVRELFADKMKVRKLMPFYKEQAQQFYEGLVTEVNFATISDLVRRRTNLLIRKQTGGRIKDFVKTNTVPLRSPLAALSANVFQTDCNSTLTSSVGRDGELYFAVSPAVRQRKLVPVPATTWRSGVLAGYEPSIDATAVALGASDRLVSTIFVLPGQQGHTAPGDTLDRLEQRLVRSAFRDGAWNKLLKVLIPRSGLELQVPKFSHRSVVNATAALKRMGLDELFSGNADFKGINGVGHRLHLADVLQMNLFSTCGDENILSGRHHVETYPASPLRRNLRRQMEVTENFGNIAEEDTSRHSGVSQEDHASVLDADQSRVDQFYRERRQLSGASERPRLKLDRPFLYFVRHNPSGIILHMGRFNPRLLI